MRKEHETYDLKNLGESELFELRVRVENEFKRRGISFGVGYRGESLAIDYFNKTPGLPTLQEAPPGTKNVDAISRDGERYSIKSIKTGSKTGTVYPDEFNPSKVLFEYMLIIKLDSAYQLESIYRVSWSTFQSIKAWDKRMSAWYVPFNVSRMKMAEQIL